MSLIFRVVWTDGLDPKEHCYYLDSLPACRGFMSMEGLTGGRKNARIEMATVNWEVVE